MWTLREIGRPNPEDLGEMGQTRLDLHGPSNTRGSLCESVSRLPYPRILGRRDGVQPDLSLHIEYEVTTGHPSPIPTLNRGLTRNGPRDPKGRDEGVGGVVRGDPRSGFVRKWGKGETGGREPTSFLVHSTTYTTVKP